MRRLAREAEVSFVFDEDLTQNPAFQPIRLIGNEDIHLIGNTAYCFENNTDHNMELFLYVALGYALTVRFTDTAERTERRLR